MARRVTISPKQRARASRKAANRARRQTASDRRLDVKIPRRQANRAFSQEARSYRAAGDYATNSLNQALSGVGRLGLGGRYERQVRDEFKGMRADVPLGVHAGVSAARQTRNDELADIAMTARSLRADQADLEHDIRRDLISKTKERKRERLATERKRAKKRKERRHDKRVEQHQNQREFDRRTKKAMQEIRAQIEGAALDQANSKIKNEKKKVASLPKGEYRAATQAEKRALRASQDRQKRLVRYLVTSQDTPQNVAEQAVSNFLRGPKARRLSERSGGSAQKAARIHERRVTRAPKKRKPYRRISATGRVG